MALHHCGEYQPPEIKLGVRMLLPTGWKVCGQVGKYEICWSAADIGQASGKREGG